MPQEPIKCHYHIDAKALSCPMPLIKAKACLHEMKADEIMRLDTCDQGSMKDIPQFVHHSSRYVMLESNEENKVYSFWIKKSG